METDKEARTASYEKRKAQLKCYCDRCVGSYPEKCNYCNIGQKLRWLETEYADITGWSHAYWTRK